MKFKQRTRSGSIFAGLISLSGILLFTSLLFLGKIGQAACISLIGLLSIVSLILLGFPRVRVIDLKNLKMVLDPMAEIKPGSYKDEKTGNRIGISVSPFYSIVKVNDIEYYFKRETGEFDGYSIPTNDQEGSVAFDPKYGFFNQTQDNPKA